MASDDHSRRPDAVVLTDQKAASAIAAVEQVWAGYLRDGVRIKRILTDNGAAIARAPRVAQVPV